MRLRLFASAMLLLLPLAAAAQRLPETPADAAKAHLVLLDDLLGVKLAEAPAESAVVPVRMTPDGRVLAAVALGDGMLPLAPQWPQASSALDWRLASVSALFSGKLRLDGGQYLHANFGYSDRNVLGGADAVPPECFGVPAWLSTMSATCAGRALADPTRWRSAEISAGWAGEALSFDLGYGASWIDGGRGGLAFAASTLGSAVAPLFGAGTGSLPSLVLPYSELGRLDSGAMIGAHGRWSLGEQAIDLGASLGRVRLLPDAAAVHSGYDQAALSFGLDRGAFTGTITGRLLAPQQPLPGSVQRWTSIDLGVTWRMPWQGQLSIGAQNLWTNPPPTTGDESENQARVPYVQYHQDL